MSIVSEPDRAINSSSERISLLDSLEERRLWLKLPLAIMQDVGPAVQTFSGLLRLTSNETFAEVAMIARNARVPVATARKHLGALADAGWICHQGRQKARGGHRRRTVTIALTQRAKEHLDPYGVLPWWAQGHIANVGKLKWSTKAVLSVVIAKLMSLKGAIEKQEYLDGDLEDEIETLGGDERFGFGVDHLMRDTGLSKPSIIDAKYSLAKLKIVNWSAKVGNLGQDESDRIVPNYDFRIVSTPTKPGYCVLSFETET